MPKQLVQLTVTQQCTASIAPVDEKGNPATLAASVWTCSDETVATIVPSDDGLSCEIIAGAPGQCRVVCNADATADKGNRAMVALVQVTVVAGKAETIGMEVTDPVEQGTAPSQGLPSRPARPGNALPPSAGHPDAGLPPAGALPGHGLPNAPARPDAGLPTAPARPDTGLPPDPAKPDAGLPPTAQPK